MRLTGLLCKDDALNRERISAHRQALWERGPAEAEAQAAAGGGGEAAAAVYTEAFEAFGAALGTGCSQRDGM